MKLLTKLHLNLSHLNEHKFNIGFNSTINSICVFGGVFESINHFILRYPEYCEGKQTLFDNIQSNEKILLSHSNLY